MTQYSNSKSGKIRAVMVKSDNNEIGMTYDHKRHLNKINVKINESV